MRHNYLIATILYDLDRQRQQVSRALCIITFQNFILRVDYLILLIEIVFLSQQLVIGSTKPRILDYLICPPDSW